jgi:hypothetical protein
MNLETNYTGTIKINELYNESIFSITCTPWNLFALVVESTMVSKAAEMFPV